MRNRSDDERVAEVTRRRLEALAAELGLPSASTTPPRPSSLGAPELEQVGDDPFPPIPADSVLVRPPRGRHARRPVRPLRRVTLWLGERVPPAARGRLDLGAAHLGLVALVLAGGLVLTAWLVMRADGSDGVAVPRAATPSVVAPGAAVSSSSSPPLSPGPSDATGVPTDATAGTGDGRLVVDVVGRVRKPGIAVLAAGARVVDAVRAAGGARPGTDLSNLNLARLLSDGEQVVVGRAAAAAVPALPASGAASSAASPSALVDINTADQTTLETLPGVGPVTAQKILEWRASNGAFTSVDELLEVSGIGEATLAEIAPHVTL